MAKKRDLRVGVGHALRRARLARGLIFLQGDLAAEAGISRPTLSDLERGRNLPDLVTLWALADALCAPIDEIVGRNVPGKLIVVVYGSEAALPGIRAFTETWPRDLLTVGSVHPAAGIPALVRKGSPPRSQIGTVIVPIASPSTQTLQHARDLADVWRMQHLVFTARERVLLDENGVAEHVPDVNGVQYMADLILHFDAAGARVVYWSRGKIQIGTHYTEPTADLFLSACKDVE